MTGTELLLKRAAAHLKAKDVAALMWPDAPEPTRASRISRLERRVGQADPVDAQKYLDAVATLTTNTTSGRAA
jgi:hypothetical protein